MNWLDVIAAVNDEVVLTRNLARSALLAEGNVTFRIQRGYRNAGTAYNDAIRASDGELLVVAHQDVYLPQSWSARLRTIVADLDVVDPGWAVLGLYGVTKARRHVGYVWSSGLNRVLGEPFEQPAQVDSVDELLVVIRRSSGVQFDENLPGFHLYGTDVVQIARASGLSAYVICAPVVHNSRPVPFLSRDYLLAHDYVRRKWRDRLPIQNCVAPIVASSTRRLRRRVRYWLDSVRHRNTDRSALERHLDCVEISKRLGFDKFCSSETPHTEGAT